MPLPPGSKNKFGIGAYYPPGAGQLADAKELVGRGGWVLILVPCGNATTETRLPPTCPGFDPAAEMRAAWQLGLNVVVRLEPQYSAWGCTGDASCQHAVCFGARPGQENWALPDPSQSWSGHLRATHDPGSNHTSFKAVARSYARVAASLPRPPDGAKLFVQLGNELNLAWDCACERGNVCMSMERVAAEAAFFSRDALAALKQVPGLAVAISPIAPVGLQARPCCHNASECRAAGGDDAACACAGGTDISFTSLSFEQLLIKAVPDLYEDVEWFSSHAYPCAGDGSGGPHDGCGLGGDPRPGTNGWNAPWSVSNKWLLVYRNEVK